jgi:hypothetical protein
MRRTIRYFNCRAGQQADDRLPRLLWNVLSGRGQGGHFPPKLRRYIQAIKRDFPQPLMFLFQYKGLSAITEAGTVSVQNDLGNISQADLDFPFRGIKDRTDAQSHQIIGIRQGASFIEIVDAPGQAAKSVPPRAEACDVQIANRQHGRRLVQLRANFRKNCAHL